MNEYQTSTNLISEPDLSEESEEENIHCQSEQTQTYRETQNERSIQDNQDIGDEATLSNAAADETYYEHIKRNKKQKQKTDNPAQQLVEILKENSIRRKRQYEEKCISQGHKITNQFENLDDMDMFFLSMSRMTKQLPKFEQAQIKLALSNSVLSAEIRCNQEPRSSAIYPNYPTQHLYVSTHSPAPSMSSLQTMPSASSQSSAPSTSSLHTMTSPIDSPKNYSITTEQHYQGSVDQHIAVQDQTPTRPTLLQMMSIPQYQYQ